VERNKCVIVEAVTSFEEGNFASATNNIFTQLIAFVVKREISQIGIDSLQLQLI